MGLSDKLTATAQPDARRLRSGHAKGYEPDVKFDGGQAAEVSISLPSIPEDEARWREEIKRVTTLSVPDHRKVELAQVRYWGEPGSEMVYCRFLITDRPEDRPDVDAAALLRSLRPRRQAKAAFTGDTSLVISWNDWQTGKLAGGGTPALAERLDGCFDAVHERARELRRIGRNLGQLVIIGGGDMIEGCTIFPNQPFEIDTDRRGQIRNTVTLGLEGLDRLAPLFERVLVLVVGGNHGEHRINGNRTSRHDNDDCAVFEHMAVAAARDSRLGHVDFVIAQDEPAKTADVNGWIIGTTHGHVFGRNVTGVEQRAWNWYRNQAAGRQPAGDCDVLVTHHYHHFASRDWGACLWAQTPALDGGSPFFTDFSGQSSDPGMLSFVVSAEKRFVDPQIL